MVDVRHIQGAPVFPVPPVSPATASPAAQPTDAFQRVLQQQLDKTQALKFSRHATERLQERGIEFSAQQMEKLTQTVGKVAEKGGRESLVLMDGVAMLVNVPQRTVITCVGNAAESERIFTNIDSAAVVG